MKTKMFVAGAVGFVLGAALFAGGAAYAEGVSAERSAQAVYIDGQRVEMEAYNIFGSNYVKLRDVGQAVGFNVYWNGAVQIDTSAPYTGEAPASAPAPQEQSAPDASASANPAIFTGSYTREAYNALRQTVATRADSAPVAMADATADYCKPFIDGLAGKSDADKVRAIALYVCDHLEYQSSTLSSPREVLTSDAVSRGNCMSYAHNFMFLCNMADIPCVFVHSADHQWNEVYVGGEWRSVDLTGTDVGYDSAKPERATVFFTKQDMQGASYQQAQPMLTMIAKEVLVPGSTK